MNKVMLIGNLTRDPEFMTSASGVNVCKFAIAVNSGFGDNSRTDFFNIVTWRSQAENCNKYLKKGNKVCVVGSLQNNDYTDKDGIKRHNTIINASEVEFLNSKVVSDLDEGVISKTEYKAQQSLTKSKAEEKSTKKVETIDEDLLPF